MAVQQLRYTWSARGLEGVSQFQVVGVSPGFRDPTSREWRWASELCSYPGLPRGENAVDWPSVGWITMRDGRRIVFHRVDAGLDGAGRRGNFASHVLIGPQEELPTSRGALLLTGELWWTGSPASAPRLPTLSLDGLESPRCGGDDPELRTALALLLDSQGTASGFARTPALAARALAVLCDVAPHLLEARSISTFEAPGEAGSYQLVGTVAGRASTRSPTAAADSVASYLLRSSADVRARTRAMLVRSLVAWESMVTTLLPFALRAAGEKLTWTQMSRVSTQFDVAVELCLYPEGRTALCAGLEEGSHEALDLLARLTSGTDTELVRRIGRDATTAAARARRHEVMAILDRAAIAARQGAADAVEESAERPEDDTFTAVLPLGVLAELLSRGTLPTRSPRRHAWVVRSAALLRSARRVPNFGRGWVELLTVLREERAWPTIATVIEGSSEAARAAVRCLGVDDWALVFGSVQASMLPAVAASSHRAGILEEAWAGAFWTAVETAGNGAGWRILEKIDGSVPVPDRRHEKVALAFLKSRAKTETTDPFSSLILARAAPSLSCCVQEHLALWGRLATNDSDATPQADNLWLLTWRPELRMHAHWAVMRRITAHPDPRSLARWAHETLISSGTKPADEARLLIATARRCRDGRHRAGVAAALLVLAHLVEDGGMPVNRLTGHLKDQATDDFWRTVAGELELAHSEVVGSADQIFGRATRAWLRSVLMDDPSPPGRGTWASGSRA